MEHSRTIFILLAVLSAIACSDNHPEQTTEPSLAAQKDNISAPIEDRVVAGDVRNTEFEVENALINNGTLTLRQGEDFFADVSVDIITFDHDEISGKTFSFSSSSNSFSRPHIRLNVKEKEQDIPNTAIIMSDYELNLIFGEKESLGIPFSIRLVALENGTNIEGKFFATYKEIDVVDGAINLTSDSFDTLDYLAKEYIESEYKGVEVGGQFGATYTSYKDDYPKSGFVGYDNNTGQYPIIKIQLAKDESGWSVVNQLKANQIHQAHPVVVDIEGDLRTVEGLKATTFAGRKLEAHLNDQNLIEATRSTSVRCYLTKAADRASCRAIYGLKKNGSVECHNTNYLLSNDGNDWRFESEILDTQKVDYNSGELVSKKPFSMSCG